MKNSWWRCRNQNNHKLDRLPEKLRENIFEKVFLVADGEPMEKIVKYTGLTIDQIERLRNFGEGDFSPAK